MGKRSKDIRNISLSDFYCTRCGCHLKKLFCLNCQDEVNMVEVRSIGKYNLDDFWIEYEYGNFDEEGNRKEPWKQFVSKTKQEIIKNEE